MARRIATTALGAALVLAGIVPAPASPVAAPSTGAVVDEAALASWTFPTRRPNRMRWFFAGAFRDETAGGKTLTFAFAVKGRCRAERGRHGNAMSCHGRGTGGMIRASRFEMDPALRRATLTFADAGATRKVVWRSARRSVPSGYFAGEACREGGGEGAGAQQPSTARGRLFGEVLTADAVDRALLARGAMVTDCTDSIPLRTLRRAAAGKPVRVVFR